MFAFLGAMLLACVDADAPLNAGDETELVFEVPPGANATRLLPALVEEGFPISELEWKLFLRQEDASCLKAGRFSLRKSMSLREVLKTLCGVPIPNDVPFTVVEGWRIRDIDAALVAAGFIEAGVYSKLAESKGVEAPFPIEGPTLEGYLYPETYMVNPDVFSAKKLIERQLQTFADRFLLTHASTERGLHAVVVMASMLEREEPTPAQRPIVAGILWKRIDNGWQLGVDATSRYTLPDWNDRRAFLKNLRDPAEPYNTRLHKGLPPTAIGNPSISALEAAVSPESSEYWFYLHDGAGVFHGGRNAAEHEANRAKYDVY